MEKLEKTDVETTQELFDSWLKIYESTYGRLLKAPAIGPAREKTEKIMQGIPNLAKLYASFADSAANVQNVFMEATRKTQEKAIEAKPENPRDLYSIWLETYSDTFKEFLKSGHFAADMGKFMSDLMDVQQYNKNMLEENVLKPMNLPTKTDIEEIYKELYLLKKKVKELTSQVKSLSGGNK